MKTKDILNKAKELISNPNHWAKGSYAFNKQGKEVSYESNDACQFCALGAINKVSSSNPLSLARYRAAVSLRKCLPKDFNYVDVFNDSPTTSHEDVLKLFDMAINRLENINGN